MTLTLSAIPVHGLISTHLRFLSSVAFDPNSSRVSSSDLRSSQLRMCCATRASIRNALARISTWCAEVGRGNPSESRFSDMIHFVHSAEITREMGVTRQTLLRQRSMYRSASSTARISRHTEHNTLIIGSMNIFRKCEIVFIS